MGREVLACVRMPGMPRAVPVLLLLAAAAHADDDPAGTVRLDLEVGHTAPIQALPGSNVICDDVSVVAPEFAEDGGGFVLRVRTGGGFGEAAGMLRAATGMLRAATGMLPLGTWGATGHGHSWSGGSRAGRASE